MCEGLAAAQRSGNRVVRPLCEKLVIAWLVRERCGVSDNGDGDNGSGDCGDGAGDDGGNGNGDCGNGNSGGGGNGNGDRTGGPSKPRSRVYLFLSFYPSLSFLLLSSSLSLSLSFPRTTFQKTFASSGSHRPLPSIEVQPLWPPPGQKPRSTEQTLSAGTQWPSPGMVEQTLSLSLSLSLSGR